MTGFRSQRSMKRCFTPTPVCSELRLFSREAITLIDRLSMLSRFFTNGEVVSGALESASAIMTPAMEAKLADHTWSVEKLLSIPQT
jgi:hypothetical protein